MNKPTGKQMAKWMFGLSVQEAVNKPFGELVEIWNKRHPDKIQLPTQWKEGEFDFQAAQYEILKKYNDEMAKQEV